MAKKRNIESAIVCSSDQVFELSEFELSRFDCIMTKDILCAHPFGEIMCFKSVLTVFSLRIDEKIRNFLMNMNSLMTSIYPIEWTVNKIKMHSKMSEINACPYVKIKRESGAELLDCS